MELQRIESPFCQEDDDGDDHSVKRIDIVSTDKSDAMLDIDPTLSDAELQDELQYLRLLEGGSS
jgi:hypothetical protein